MNHKIKIALTALVFLLNILVAAADELQYKNFEWSDKPLLHELTTAEKKESVVMLTEHSAIEYIYNDKKELELYSFRHKIMALNDDKAVESANRIYLPARNPELLITLKARVINRTGVVKELGKTDMKEINEDGVNYLILAIEGLEKGCEIEYYFLLKRQLNYWGTETMQSAYFVRQSKVEIITPSNLKTEAKVYNGKKLFEELVNDDKRFLTCTTDSIIPKYTETYSANDANVMRTEYKLASNTARSDKRFFTFDDAGERYFDMLTVRDKDEDKEVKSAMKKMDLGNKSEPEKISILENYIKTNIQILEQSDDDNLKTILKNKYGSESGIMRLFVAMFDAADINFQTVMTCSKYERTFDKDFDSWIFLDKYLFYFPGTKLYLDPAAVAYRLGLIPYIYENNYGLYIAGVKLGDKTVPFSEVKKIEAYPSKNSFDNMDCTVTFPADFGKADVHQIRTMAGHSAVGIRPYYAYGKEDDKKQIVNQLVQLKGEETKVTDVKVSNYDLTIEDVKKPFTVECNYSSSYLLEAAGDNYILKIGEIIGPQVEMYSEKPRVSDVMMEFTHSYVRNIKVIIPNGYEVKGADKLNFNIVIDGPGGSKLIGFLSSYKIENNAIIVTVNEYYNVTEFPVSKFEDFRKVINASADFNKVSIVLSKK